MSMSDIDFAKRVNKYQFKERMSAMRDIQQALTAYAKGKPTELDFIQNSALKKLAYIETFSRWEVVNKRKEFYQRTQPNWNLNKVKKEARFDWERLFVKYRY